MCYDDTPDTAASRNVTDSGPSVLWGYEMFMVSGLAALRKCRARGPDSLVHGLRVPCVINNANEA
jgi:hypothetical protein